MSVPRYNSTFYKEKKQQYLNNLVGSTIDKRNYLNQEDYVHKPFSKSRLYQQSTPALKSSVAQAQISERTLHEKPIHLHNWKIVKERQYAFQQKNAPEDHDQQKIVAPHEYQAIRNGKSLTAKNSQSQSQFQPRENMYVTKPLIRLDKDFKHTPIIRNVQTTSDDTPLWCQSPNKYYAIDFIDKQKKDRSKKPVVQTDLFGVPLKNFPEGYNENFKFRLELPFSNLRGEPIRMQVCDKEEVQFKKKHNLSDLRHSNVNIQWNEDIKKQKFDNYLSRTTKVFSNQEKPYIQKLENSRRFPNDQDMLTNKIGSSQNFNKLDKDKPVQLKIGHGQPDTINPLKYEQCLNKKSII